VLADGRIQQVGQPIELYRAPVNRFVAGFIGTPRMNFVEGHLGEDLGAATFIAEGARVKLTRAFPMAPGSSASVTLGVRPEDLQLSASASSEDPASDTLLGRVVLVERLGGTSHVHLDVGAHRLLVSVSDGALPHVGDHVAVRVPSDRVYLFAADGRALR
jgi:ABC-type sugar transport system ATPase subunit